jgi:hypothetical protein
MNRLVGMLARNGKEAIAFSPAVPMALRGPVESRPMRLRRSRKRMTT